MATSLPDKTTTIDPKNIPTIIDGLATGGVVLPVVQFNGLAPPVASPGGLSGALTEWVLVLAGVVLVAIVYENDRKAGALLLIIMTLLMLMAAQQRGLL